MSKPLVCKIGGADPAAEFDKVTNAARRTVLNNEPGADEPTLCAGFVQPKTIDQLNLAAARCFDHTANSVRFYGGYLHSTPQATFDAESISRKETRTCELADLMIIVVRTEPDPHDGGASIITEKRACLIQAKMSNQKTQSRLYSFEPKGPALPAKGSPETQLYLLWEWPLFTLSFRKWGPKKKKVQYDLSKVQPIPMAIGRYSHILSAQDEAALKGVWKGPHDHSWKHVEPVPNAVPEQPLGDLLAKMGNLEDGAGVDYFSLRARVDPQWAALIDDLTERCQRGKWRGHSREANPAGLNVRSWIDMQADLHTLQRFGAQQPFPENELPLRASKWNPFSASLIEATAGSSWTSRLRRFFGIQPRGLPILIMSINSRPHGQSEETRVTDASAGAAFANLGIYRHPPFWWR